LASFSTIVLLFWKFIRAFSSFSCAAKNLSNFGMAFCQVTLPDTFAGVILDQRVHDLLTVLKGGKRPFQVTTRTQYFPDSEIAVRQSELPLLVARGMLDQEVHNLLAVLESGKCPFQITSNTNKSPVSP